MKIQYIQINNILSIEDVNLPFQDNGLVLFEGWNYDDGRANGAGKSAVFNAISFALFDKMPRKVSVSEIVRRGQSKGSAECAVDVNGTIWKVIRSRPKGVQFFKDGIQVDITQTEWEQNIKLNYDQFLISMYCSQSNSTRFLSLNDSDKKDFILQLLDLNRFAALKLNADTQAKLINVKLTTLKDSNNKNQSKIDAYTESIIDESAYLSEINKLENEIAELNKGILSFQAVAKPDMSKYFQIEKQISDKEKDIASAETHRSILSNTYRKQSQKIRPFSMSSTCTECGAELDIKDAKAHHEREQEKVKAELLSIKEEMDGFDSKIAKKNEIIDLKQKIYEKKTKESEDYTNAQRSISERQRLVDNKTTKISDLNRALDNNQVLISKIDSLKEIVSSHNIEISENVKNYEYYKTLSNIYSPTGAQAYVLDTVIDSFNELIPNYIQLLWPTATYELKTYKETSKGDITAKFSECLTINGKEVSIGSLSGGEMRAISLCVDFAIIDIMNNYFNIRMNPIVLDEPFEGLDAVGKEIVIELLHKISGDKQIIVVDHGSESQTLFSKTVRVEKRSGLTTLKF